MEILNNILSGSFGIAEVITIIAAVLLVLGITKSGKNKATGKTFLWIGGIGLLVTLGLPFVGIDLLGGLGTTTPGAVTTTGTTPTPTLTTICAVEDTTVTLSAQNKYTSVSTGGTHRYRINGSPALTVADAGTLTASPGDNLEILWGNATDSTYYGQVETVTVPCAGTKSFSTELVQNGTLTIEVFNEENNLISAPENKTF